MVQIRKETTNMWKYKVGNNVNIVNFFEKPDCKTKKFANINCMLQAVLINNYNKTF